MRLDSLREIQSMRLGQRGMTLVELMITVVIVAILASIALPSYRNYMIRTYRSEAKSALLQVQATQEKFYLQYSAYSNNLTAAPPDGLGLIDKSENGKYNIAIAFKAGRGNQAYTATATPVSGSGQDRDTKCTQFSIDETGLRSSTGTVTVAECWR